jgi:hypothetical protein
MLKVPTSGEAYKKSSNLDKWAIAISLITLVISTIAIYQSHQSIQLQNISSNFEITIIPYIVEADFGVLDITNNSTSVSCQGFLNLKFSSDNTSFGYLKF